MLVLCGSDHPIVKLPDVKKIEIQYCMPRPQFEQFAGAFSNFETDGIKEFDHFVTFSIFSCVQISIVYNVVHYS